MATLDTAIALVSLDEAKEFCKITASTDDALLNGLINKVSALANQYTGRHLLQKTHTLYFNGTGTPEIIVPEFPIISVTSLNDDLDRSFGSSTAIDVSADVLVDKEGGILTLWNTERAFQVGRGNVKLVMSAGYALASVPYNLALAVDRGVQSFYDKATKRRGDVVSETVGDRTTTFVVSDLPVDVKALLNPYKQRVGCTEYFRG